MNPDQIPTRVFLERSDAEAALRTLAAAGMRGRIMTDPPPGWRMGGSLPFTLWVDREDHGRADELLRQNDPPPLLCERCHGEPATVHLTIIRDGISTTSNFCRECSPEGPAHLDPDKQMD